MTDQGVQLYAAVNHRRYRVGGGKELILVRDTGATVLFPASSASLLSLCGPCRSLGEHVRYAATLSGLNSEQATQVAEVLELFVKSGLLIRKTFNSVATDGAQTTHPPAISTIGVVSGRAPLDRNECISSIRKRIRHAKHCVRISIVCDHPDVKPIAGGESDDRDPTITYAGSAEKTRFAMHLVEMGMNRAVINLALFGWPGLATPIGANRNCLLLDTVGEILVSCDDDIRWHTAVHSSAEQALRWGSHRDPYDYWYFPSHESALANANWLDMDILSQYSAVLGQPLKGISDKILGVGKICSVDQVCGHLSHSLDNPRSAIALAMCGLIGDSGTFVPPIIGPLTPLTRANLFKDLVSYEHATTSRQIWALSPSYTLTHTSTCMAYLLGIDNRSFMPPFVPNARNEDGVFGQLVEACYPHAYMCHLPFGVVHDSGLRRYEVDHVQYAARTRLSDVFLALIHAWSCPEYLEDPTLRCTHLGAYLRALGELSESKFSASVREAVLLLQSARVSSYVDLAKADANQPVWWLAEIDRVKRSLMNTMRNSHGWHPYELAPAGHASAVTLRSVVGSFGELLTSWPSIVSAARSLNADGIRLSREYDARQ